MTETRPPPKRMYSSTVEIPEQFVPLESYVAMPKEYVSQLHYFQPNRTGGDGDASTNYQFVTDPGGPFSFGRRVRAAGPHASAARRPGGFALPWEMVDKPVVGGSGFRQHGVLERWTGSVPDNAAVSQMFGPHNAILKNGDLAAYPERIINGEYGSAL